jgi:hypothetical protein
VKYVFIAAIAAIIARGILGLMSPLALTAPDRPKPVAPHVEVSREGLPGTVSGHVYDAKSGEPLEGVAVVVEQTDLGASTDVRGTYTIARILAGKYEVSASYVGFRQLRANIVLDSVNGVRVDFWLTWVDL